jgi:hypothetical protein
MMRAVAFVAVASVMQVNALNPDFVPKTINQQFSALALKNVKFLQVLPVISAAVGMLVSAVEKKSFEYQPALAGLDYGKPRTYYPDFVQKTSGLQYKVVKEGKIYPWGITASQRRPRP